MTDLHIRDFDDFCRPCRGKGYSVTVETSAWPPYRPVTVSRACWLCGGTGLRTVLLSAPKAGAA